MSREWRTRCLGLVLELLQQVAKHGADLAVGKGCCLVERSDGAVELGELLELQRLDNGRDILAELIALAEQLLVLGLEQSITRAAIVCQFSGAPQLRALSQQSYLVSVRMKRPIFPATLCSR